jgi:murein DD-endopeptidase MepM/ murein hydrolase activator NlpD
MIMDGKIKNIQVIFVLLLLCVAQIGFAQSKNKKKRSQNTKKQVAKEFKGDFKEIKVPQKMWIPSDSSLLKIKLNNVEEGDEDIALQDTLMDNNVSGTGGSPFASHFTSPAFDYRAKASKRKNVIHPNPQPFADTVNVNRLYHQEGVFTGIDLTVGKSLLREDTTDLYDTNDEEMVEVSEELAIDCVWVKLTGYYAIWDSNSINPYKVDIQQFKDTVNLVLYDTTKDFRWSSPLVSNKVTSDFGHRWHRWHHGVDLDLEIGDSVLSSFDGIVRLARFERWGYGNYIILRHYNGIETLYGHLSKSLVEVGDHVRAGELIGYGGSTGRSTGPHLHYELRYQGYAFDPRVIYDFESNKIIKNTFTLTPEHFGHLTKQRQTIWHKVKRGESLSRIASRYKVSVTQLCQLNKMNKNTALRSGKRLRVR